MRRSLLKPTAYPRRCRGEASIAPPRHLNRPGSPAMKWSEQVRDGVASHLQVHGLDKCPVCQSDTLDVCDRPVLMVLGGAAWPNPPHIGPMDPDTEVNFM